MDRRVTGLRSATWLLLALPWLALAHSGGLDRHGCHHNRKTGDYHCHRQAGTRPASPSPAASPAASELAARPARASTTAYANCAEARAAGAAPVRRGQPGYGAHLDRDNDGIGCE
ncbi:excalibur calcium-binding domain-containing protein [Pseudoxanthomonas dokdonensis]|uniref:Calcium-binding protein n=1 Tax=Pseudoxanthomonas dokdonensis TaxID=344882 RepID=A0A0R0D275_9GAMM|nr:excalibur calcium-binding domain-containing protein [Pseudoxanthomonas dokdonensis]KRG71683.1 calcium-binding protein [Pseudoxanthomonas dokdonensis]